MLATGSTLQKIVESFKNPGRIITSHAVCHEVGVRKILPLIDSLYTAGIDPVLNDKGYILPRLGDAGDRAYGTSH